VTRDELVQAVIANPDSDAPRKAFAAWGVAQGDPQGELARLQLADREHRQKRGRSGEDRRAANRLIEEHGATWARPVTEIGREPRFSRGFVEGVTLDAPTFLARAPELFSIAPIRAVTFVDAASHVAAIAASPYLARLVAIQFYNKSHASPLGDEGLRKLVASPHLGKLAMLQLAFNDLGRAGMEALAAARLRNLRYASLGNNREDSPVEEYGIDGINGEINNNSISLPDFGRELEAKYGEQAWLHAPSLLRVYPPDESDF
jgi:uncharacterized protein (TIGR02996 family)